MSDDKIVISFTRQDIKTWAIIAGALIAVAVIWNLWIKNEDYKQQLVLAQHPAHRALVLPYKLHQQCLRESGRKYRYCSEYSPPAGWSEERYQSHCASIHNDIIRRGLDRDFSLRMAAEKEYRLECIRPKRG